MGHPFAWKTEFIQWLVRALSGLFDVHDRSRTGRLRAMSPAIVDPGVDQRSSMGYLPGANAIG